MQIIPLQTEQNPSYLTLQLRSNEKKINIPSCSNAVTYLQIWLQIIRRSVTVRWTVLVFILSLKLTNPW